MEKPRKSIQFTAMTLPWEQLRSYPDIGDWMVNSDNSPAIICAADTGDDVSNAAILIHEIVEALLCWKHGVKEEYVTAFDREWFTEKHGDDEEPGNDIRSPYREWHQVAEMMEREFILRCGCTWEKHTENCRKIYADA